MTIDWYWDWCLRSVDGRHRFWLELRDGSRRCINCGRRDDDH
jgi:hypothetical protein